MEILSDLFCSVFFAFFDWKSIVFLLMKSLLKEKHVFSYACRVDFLDFSISFTFIAIFISHFSADGMDGFLNDLKTVKGQL